MKVLFLLFIIFITYSNAIDFQSITLGADSPKDLRTSVNDDYFYFKKKNYITYKNINLLLYEDSYFIKNIYYCFLDYYPSDSTIDQCSFNSISYDGSKSTSTGTLYHYNIPLTSSDLYVIIKYSGRHSYGTFKARSYLTERIYINSYDKKELSALPNIKNYFYISNFNSKYDYLYLNLSEIDNSLEPIIYYTFTDKDPEYYYPTDFNILYFDDTEYTNSKYEYHYKIEIKSSNKTYIVVKYFVHTSTGPIYASSSYNEFSSKKTSSSTLPIVFIAIGGLVFVGILIAIICYCYKKRAAKNLNNSNQPDALIPEQQDEIIQNPSYPSME